MIYAKNIPDVYNLIEYDIVDSTMITLKELVKEGAKVGTIVSAKKQYNGRGRHGRKWISPEGNLYFSFLRQAENKKFKNVFAPVFITAVALAETISLISKKKILPILKWPNDVLINNSKVAGILIESFNNNGNDLLNIGVGINIKSNPTNTIYSATNLYNENIEVPREVVLNCFFNCLYATEQIFLSQGIKEIFRLWLSYSYKVGTKIGVKIGENRIEGSFNGLDSDGSLLLVKDSGEELTILTGDVFYYD